jgi:hypothetical protein
VGAMTRKVIKDTKYCQILNQGKVADEEYTYSIEKIFIKAIKRDEIRCSLYKDTIRSSERYIPKSLDITEGQLLQLIKEYITAGVFSKEFIKNLSQVLNRK